MHRTPQNRRGCIIFWHSNALIQEVLAENGFWYQIATQGHLRSFILQSVTGRQGVAYRHIILLAVSSLTFSRTYGSHVNRQKIAVVDNPNVVWRPGQDEPPRISAWTMYFQKLQSLAYIFAADSIGPSSFKFVQWAPKDASTLQQSAGRKRILTSNNPKSFKVIHFAISYRPTRRSISQMAPSPKPLHRLAPCTEQWERCWLWVPVTLLNLITCAYIHQRAPLDG